MTVCEEALASGPDLGPALVAIRETVSAIESLDSLTDDELLALTGTTERLARQVEGLQLTCAAEINKRSTERPKEQSLSRTRGFRTSVDLLRQVTLESAPQIRSRIRLADKIGPASAPKYEHVAQAIRSGDLSARAASLITNTLEKAQNSDPEKLEAAERAMVEAATEGTEREDVYPHHYEGLRVVCDAWALQLESAPDSEEEAFRRRGFRFAPEKAGLVAVRGELVPEVAAALYALIQSVNSRVDSTDRRSVSQRAHDAFAAIVNVAAASSQIPTSGGAPVTVMVQTTAEALSQGKGGWMHGANGTLTPLSAEATRYGACSGALEFYATDKNKRLVALGNRQRTFNSHQRRAITARDGGCVIPGCQVSTTWCEIHHVQPHAQGGQTHTDNGVMLCYFHHRTLDSSGWEVRMRDGYPQVRAPAWVDAKRVWRRARAPSQILDP